MANIKSGTRLKFRETGPRRSGFGARLLNIVFGLLAVWLLGLLGFAAAIPTPSPDAPTANARTDAIIVLTGGADRLAEGFNLLNRRLADKLLISGVAQGVTLQQLIDRLGDQSATLPPAEELSCCVTLGYEAESTVGNAEESAEWLHRNGATSVRLVTANYHMLRSLLEFRRLIPGIRVVPNPVFPNEVRDRYWFIRPKTVMLIVNEYHKYLIALGRALPSDLQRWSSSRSHKA
jgi:uncharacterized SAM-binding protein YcdF (DUF218 family)